MKTKNAKIIGLLFLFFSFDFIRPFGYFFLPNLTLLAVISLILYSRLSTVLFFSLLAGAAHDSLIFPRAFFFALIYPLFALASFYFNKYLLFLKAKNKPLAVKMIPSGCIIILYSLFSIFFAGIKSLPLFVLFFLQAYLAFFLIDYLIQKSLNKILIT